MHATIPSAQPQQELSPADTALVRDLGGFAKFILHSGGKEFYEAVGELDLSISQIRILHLLTREVESASLKGLADAIGLSLPAVSRSIDALVHRDLVTREENAVDRRLKTVRATPQALSLVDRLMELRLAGIADFVRTLAPEERLQLAAALDPIVARPDIAPLCMTPKEAGGNA
jgi:DNA-binding MarR family transcriptional regulator